MSDSRITADSRMAAATSSSSPTLWPMVSLVILKSSRSTNSTPVVVPVALGPGQRVRGPVLEQQPVGQAGQRVVEGPVLELGFQLPLLGDITHGQHQAGHGVVVPQVAGADLDLDAALVAADDLPVLEGGPELAERRSRARALMMVSRWLSATSSHR